MSKIGSELVKVIKDKEFQHITKDIVEAAIDTKIPESVLKEIPLLSTIIGTFNAISNIKDRLFMQKLLSFLYELKTSAEDEIIEQIIKLEDDNTYRTKVGEKLLYIIDKCEDPDKASWTGSLFKAFLEKKINYDEFLSATSVIERTPLPDLVYFINTDFDDLDLEGGGSEFVSYGLMEIRISAPKIKIEKEPYHDSESSYSPSEDEILEERIRITNFHGSAHVSWAGRNIRECLAKKKTA